MAAAPVTRLAEPSTVTSIEALAARLQALNEHFNRTGDRRGVFTAVYAPCVQRLVREIRSGGLQDPGTAERVVLALGRAYLEGLRRDGRGPAGGPGDRWDAFTALTRDPKVSDARLLASSINAHWSADLPGALVAARAPAGFEADFQRLGRFLVDEVQRGLARPVGPNGQRVARVFQAQPALAGLARVFGLDRTMSTGMAVLLAEAFATSRRPGLLGAPNAAKWSVREALGALL